MTKSQGSKSTGSAVTARENAVIGDRDGTEVSLQLLQDVYNEITGKSEKLSKRYDVNFRIQFADIQQLHHLVGQLCEQYNIKAHNESVTVYFEEDSQNLYSSFDRFSMIDESSVSAVEGVQITYNFMVVVPKSRRPQSYTLKVMLDSRVVDLKKMRADDFPRPMIQILGKRTAHVDVEYIDYVIARNLIDGVDRWISGLPTYDHPAWLKTLQKYSGYIRQIFRYGLGTLAAYYVFKLVPVYVPSSDPDFEVLAKFTILGSLAIFILFRLGFFLGRRVENALDDFYPLSYIRLNRGDERVIADARRSKTRQILRIVWGAVGTIGLGVATTFISNWLIPS